MAQRGARGRFGPDQCQLRRYAFVTWLHHLVESISWPQSKTGRGDLWPVADDLFGASGVRGFYEVDRNFTYAILNTSATGVAGLRLVINDRVQKFFELMSGQQPAQRGVAEGTLQLKRAHDRRILSPK